MKIRKSLLKGSLSIPASKSQSLRAILFASLALGKSTIRSPLFNSSDLNAMIDACRLIGANISIDEETIVIEGINQNLDGAEDVINAQNSGIVLRFMAALCCHSMKPIVITGDYSIRHQRPIEPLLKALRGLGAKAISTKDDGYAPIILQGPFTKSCTKVLGQDSQFVSALLISGIMSGLEFEVEKAGETPWIDLTLHWLKKLNVTCTHQDYSYFKVEKQSKLNSFDYKVPGDLSSLSFPLAACLLGAGDLTLKNVDLTDCQGDKKLIEVFEQMGAKFTIDSINQTIKATSSELRGVDIDINDFIDALPILATVACFAKSKTRIYNASNARNKESNRIKSIATELSKMGAHIVEEIDGLTVYPSTLKGSKVFSHQDHRIAMSLAIAALACQGDTFIEDSGCVSKTYPHFFDELKRLGGHLS